MSLLLRRRVFHTQALQRGIGELIEQIHSGKIKPEKDQLLELIKQCGHERALPEGRRLFEFIDTSPYRNDRYVLNLLMDMYNKLGLIEEVRALFNRIPQKNEFSWTLIVKAYAQNGHLLGSLFHFRRLLQEGVDPSDYACSIVLGVCCSLNDVSVGRAVHTVILGKGYESDVFVAAGLIHMYIKCGCLGEAVDSFKTLLHKDRFVYTAMLGGFAQFGCNDEALGLFRRMDLDGIKPDDITLVSAIGAFESLRDPVHCRLIHECAADAGVEESYLVQTALLNMYSRCGSIQEALRVFDKMILRDKVAWSSTISACSQHGHGLEAIHLFKRMELEGIKADVVVLSSLLDACASVEAIEEGRRIHERIVLAGYTQDRVLKAAILNMYSRCGNATGARRVFDEQMPGDTISWNVLIGAYAKAGLDEEAVETLRRMLVDGVEPSVVTFIVVLSACSHGGFLREGRAQFRSMVEDFLIDPDADCYCCMVDLLARSGELEAGESLLRSMPFEPLEAGWTCLLSACGFHGQADRAARAAQHAASFGTQTSSNYVLLSNLVKDEDEAESLHELTG